MTSELTADGRAVVYRIQAEDIQVVPLENYGWRDAVELAVIDAVLSIQARYGTETTGVLGRVNRYRAVFGDRADDLLELSAREPSELVAMLGTQKSAQRLKADIVRDVAGRLVKAGVVHAGQVDPTNDDHRRAWTDTKGLGWVTREYFTMLVGRPGVKADTMVRRFVAQALRLDAIEDLRARDAVLSAATHLEVNARDLDHSIWRFTSGRGPR